MLHMFQSHTIICCICSNSHNIIYCMPIPIISYTAYVPILTISDTIYVPIPIISYTASFPNRRLHPCYQGYPVEAPDSHFRPDAIRALLRYPRIPTISLSLCIIREFLQFLYRFVLSENSYSSFIV